MSAPSQPQAGSASANHPETRPLPTGPKGAGTSPPVRRRGETWTRPPCGGHDGARGHVSAFPQPPCTWGSSSILPHPCCLCLDPLPGGSSSSPKPQLRGARAPAACPTSLRHRGRLCPLFSHQSGRFPLTVLATPHQGSGLDSGLGLPNPLPPEPGTPVLPVPSGPLTPSAPAPSISPGPEPCGTPDPPGLFLSPQVLRASCGEHRKAPLLPASV